MIGQTISHYRVLEPLGKGGMGVVYKAQDTRLGRLVALKFLQNDLEASTAFVERFHREARAASSLNHPNLCTIYEADVADGRSFIAMELIEGRSLNDMLQAGPLSMAQALDLAVQIADGLAFAHSKGIVHRDIKPANTFVTDRGQAKILDFGLAKQTLVDPSSLDSEAVTIVSNLTVSGTLVGTMAYVAPEQARGLDTDARADLFSFGAMLYEMVTGQQAFRGLTSAAVFDEILNRKPDSPARINPLVPQRLEELIFKALRKDRETRFQSAREMLDELKTLQRDIAAGLVSGAPVAGAPVRSIAVLPFADMSAEQDQEYFCDGMAEELINAFSNIEGLRVASRTSAFRFKKQELDVGAIGEQLKANVVLEGSVRRMGKRLRITAKLVDVATSYPVWSEKYDRDMEDVFAVQDEIARNIVDKLKVQLVNSGMPLVRRSTDNLEAYNLYLKGRYYWNKRYQVGLQKGMECFQQAIEKDPGYALAYTGLADSFSVLSTYNFVGPMQGLGRAKALALRAVELDDGLAEAHSSLGYARLFHDWDWTAAENCFLRSIELNGSYGAAHYWYATNLAVMQRFELARKHCKIALDLEPLSPLVNAIVGWVFLLEHCLDEAIAQLRTALEMEPGSYLTQSFLGLAYLDAAMFDEAIAMMKQAAQGTGSRLMLQGLSMAYGAAGREAEALAIQEQLAAKTDTQYLSPFFAACTWASLKQVDRAIACLEQGFQDRDGAMIYVGVFPRLIPLHSDPRFQDLLRRMNLSSRPGANAATVF